MRRFLRFLAVWCVVVSSVSAAPTAVPDNVGDVLAQYCLDCHDANSKKGDINLEFTEIEWNDPDSAKHWVKVYDVLRGREMPPAKKKQPLVDERAAVVAWLEEVLLENDPPGGTVLRRLNREEYENTVRDVFQIPFDVPKSFPSDNHFLGFDNLGESLVLSPPLMAQYLEIATSVADTVIPPPLEMRRPKKDIRSIRPGDFTLNFTTGHEIDGVLRMVSSSDPLARGSIWPNRFEAKVAAVYRVKIDISSFHPPHGHVPVVQLLRFRSDAQPFTKASSLPVLAEFKITNDQPETFLAEVELQPGETIVVHYENAPLSSDQRDDHVTRISRQLLDLFRKDPELGAAWMQAGYRRSDRGWSWYRRIEEIRKAGGLDVESFDPDAAEVREFTRKMSRQPVNLVETLCCFRFFSGPGIDIHQMSVTAPIRLIKDDKIEAQKAVTARFMGERNGLDDRAYAEVILRAFLDKAFRRPATGEQVSKFVGIAMQHVEEGHRFEDGIHLAVRAAICSPNFLFRGQRVGALDDYDLASRLSYFLTSSPPDTALLKAAARGRLSSDPAVLEAQTRRLLRHNRVKNFLASFTGQWLDLRLLPDIMPDPRLLKWTEKDLESVTAETELFVAEILRENHPIETFIDPDFTYLNKRNAKLYGIKHRNSDVMKRVTLKRGHRHGGILGHASVMMATANGVDTQPVIRGVWLLENVLGDPVPEPPSSVPAIEPDTTGAKSIRELLVRHQVDADCARCHKKIDPPGFALENFDPVGRWRESYPIYQGRGDKIVRKAGLPVDTRGTLVDGTELEGVHDLKKYLVENIDIFSRCLAEKLLVYATGRTPSFGDLKEIERIARETSEQGNGFQDLIIGLVLSESFQTK